MQIAICDDDALIVEQLQKYLEQYFRKHHLSCPKTQHFSSGDALLSDMNEKDLVFLDVEMPGMSGIETLDAIRAKSECAKLPIAFLSASEDMEQAVANGEYAVQGFIKKPFLPQKLYESVDALLA